MCQTRISGDVWQLALEVAQARGLGNPRTAIEAIVRMYAAAYIGGQPAPSPACPTESAQPIAPLNEPSAQDSLNSLLSEMS